MSTRATSPDVDLALSADVADEEQVASIYARTSEAFGRIDVLSYNAGISPTADGSVVDTDLDVWERVQAVNPALGLPVLRPVRQASDDASYVNATTSSSTAA